MIGFGLKETLAFLTLVLAEDPLCLELPSLFSLFLKKEKLNFIVDFYRLQNNKQTNKNSFYFYL